MDIEGKAHPDVVSAVRYLGSGIVDLNQAIRHLKIQVDSTANLATSTTTTTATGTVSSNVNAAQAAGLVALRGFFPGQVFQNLAVGAMVVTVGVEFDSGFTGTAYVDSTPSLALVVAEWGGAPTYPGAVTFVVPQGFYYGVSADSGATIRSWTEWTLL